MATLRCCLCLTELEATAGVERASVRCNVRAFASEHFEVWRCPACRSIHAAREVDLPHYYARYPFHRLADGGTSGPLRIMYGNLARRLTDAGCDARSAILDYGCGSGGFLALLRERGFAAAVGFDEYEPSFADRAVLERSYDCVLAQDLIEHVADPRALVATLHALVRPGGVILIGTPDATHLDLGHPERHLHSLHQPYHRHVLSEAALHALGAERGWKLRKHYREMYSNTRVPFVNAAFLQHYFRSFDDNVDLALDPPDLSNWKLWTPKTLWLGLFGSFTPPRCDMMAVFERPAEGPG